MTEPFDELLYKAGLTAQGCWDQLDRYDQEAIIKFAKLVVLAVIEAAEHIEGIPQILEHFGVEK